MLEEDVLGVEEGVALSGVGLEETGTWDESGEEGGQGEEGGVGVGGVIIIGVGGGWDESTAMERSCMELRKVIDDEVGLVREVNWG